MGWLQGLGSRKDKNRMGTLKGNKASGIFLLKLAILDLMSQPRTPSFILEMVVYFLIVKVLFSFLRDEWMTELTVGEQLPSVETGWISSLGNCKTFLSPAPVFLTPSWS